MTAGRKFRFHGGSASEGWQSPVDCSCLESSRPRKGSGGSNPSPSAPMTAEALADAEPGPYWLDQPGAPDAGPPLDGRRGGRPGRGRRRPHGAVGRPAGRARRATRVVLLEGERVAFGASGRNGGFSPPRSPTGSANGLARWPDEIARSSGSARENLAGSRRRSRATASTPRFGRPASSPSPPRPPGRGPRARAPAAARARLDAELLDAPRRCAPRCARRRSWAAAADRDGAALVDPARLAWGLRGAARAARRPDLRADAGRRALARAGAGVRADAPRRPRCARARVVLGTSAFPPLVRRSGATSCRSTTTCSSPSR